jgi:hypothetical protein
VINALIYPQLTPSSHQLGVSFVSFPPHTFSPAQFDAHFAHHRFRESVHIGFRFFVAECVQRRAKAMAEEPAKRIPDWLEFDLLVIVVSLALICLWIWIDI